ncbi:MAG: HAD family hydrolase [Clostridiales bacterium]|nr:HAD family hydrolase [Clostridiales bacterium]
MLKAILFDLDGTLLAMDQAAFISAYFKEIMLAAAPLNYGKDELIAALWRGTASMLKNDGRKTNRERFWDDFAKALGEHRRADEKHFDRFYANEFDNARRCVKPRKSARAELEELRRKGYLLALATNPMFPRAGIERRLDWAGLDAELFDHITDYETARYSKPNPLYYGEILAALGRSPGEALMVGNNPVDDMAAAALGMQVFLVTDFLENERGVDISSFPQGDYERMLAMLRELPALA